MAELTFGGNAFRAARREPPGAGRGPRYRRGVDAKVDSRYRAARAAVFATFTLNGFLLAMWVVHIPAITDRTGVSAELLGMFVLVLAGAALIGMRAAGPAADRFGSRPLVALAAGGVSVAVLGPGFAGGPVALGLTLAVFGLANGALDVSMNTQAVLVERAYGRPIMSAFHAMFSGGGFAGSLVGWAAQHAGVDLRVTVLCASAAGLLATTVLVPRLLPTGTPHATIDVPGPAGDTPGPTSPAGPDSPARPAGEPGATPGPAPEAGRVSGGGDPAHDRAHGPEARAHSRKVFALGAIAFVLLLTEGAAADWSALQVRGHLNTSEATAALAFGAFSAAMTLGRFGADRVAGAIGRVAMVRYGSLLAAAGLALVVASPWLITSLLGWTLCGFGIAGGVPQIFTAAGNLGTATAATDMSRVFTVGYLGLLAGPAVIGWLTVLVPLTAALIVPLVLVLLCAWRADVVAPPAPAG